MSLKYTPVSEVEEIHAKLSRTFESGVTLPLSYRRAQLLQLARLAQENADAIAAALYADLGRSKFEALLPEVSPIVTGSILAASNLEEWAKPEKPEVEAWRSSWDTTIHKIPKGVVTIIGPWNYPYTLTLLPFIGAIAAGCTCVVKPSEFTPFSSQLLADLFARYLDPNAYAVINGAEVETTRLLSLKWNHIFFTGSPRIGRLVAAAAAKHVTPLTLELGGKSPVVVDVDNTDLDIAAKRILWGKHQNGGQVCVSPDYVLVPRHRQNELVAAFQRAYSSFYPHPAGAIDPASQLTSVVNAAHHSRLMALLESTRGQVVTGGKAVGKKRIDVTVLRDVELDDPLMQDENFGPILPIVPVDDVSHAIRIIRERPVPLVIYLFTDSDETKEKFIHTTQSGQLVLNDTFQQLAVHEMSFGGQGDSGYGGYLGKHSFETFTHRRGYVNVPPAAESAMQFRYPPYSEQAVQVALAAVMTKIPDA